MDKETTTEEKNIAIAEMLGFKFEEGLVIPVPHWVTGREDFHYNPSEFLKFHSDANWQYEAINWIEKQGYDTTIAGNCNSSCQNCYISSGSVQGDGGNWFESHVDIDIYGTKKEAVFEALYQFSQYLKDEK